MEPLQQLARRVRLKRWLGSLHRLAWILAVAVLVLFLADLAFGVRTLGLRIASAVLMFGAASIFLVDVIAAWRMRLDAIGLAQLVEKKNPALAERLLTLVQLDSKESSAFSSLLKAETARVLANVRPSDACPVTAERRWWLGSLGAALVVFGGLMFLSAFRDFAYRSAVAWQTPLTPLRIDVSADSYALRGQSLPIEATITLLDPHAPLPRECNLICAYEGGIIATTPMTFATGKFVALLENVRQSVECRVEAVGATSAAFTIQVLDAPAFFEPPTVSVAPPRYMASEPTIRTFGENVTDVLQYSKVGIRFCLEQKPAGATVLLTRVVDAMKNQNQSFALPIRWEETNCGIVSVIAQEPGDYEARLLVDLEHGLKASLAIGQWTVHADTPPRFTQSVRLYGAAGKLDGRQEYRIAADDSLKLQTAVEDAEGLGPVSFEYRVNDGPSRTMPWLDGKPKTALTIDDWLPLPSTLKPDDRVQFRIHATDNRRLQKGEVSAAEEVPPQDLEPQMVSAPNEASAWITLRVDRASGGFVKDQTLAQANELTDIVGKIKKKLQGESTDVQQLQRMIHQQPALMPSQLKQAEKIKELNRAIAEDLLEAGRHFLSNPALAGLADHFFDIAESEMTRSGDALERFRDKTKPVAEAEKELQTAQDALADAAKRLERILDWNKMIAQDRLDQWQIEKLQKRQRELAERLAKLNEQTEGGPEVAKEMEAIRQEQAKLAEETADLQAKSRLVQESLAALEQMRTERLAQAAKELADEQQTMRELDPGKMPKELKDRLTKLTERQADLAKRVSPFAAKNQGPDVVPAADAAVSLRKPKLDEAIAHQKEHGQRLHDWFAKLLPGAFVNRQREQVHDLAKSQKAIGDDLQKLAAQLANLDEQTIGARLREITKRQRDLQQAVAKLPIERVEAKLLALQKIAVQSAERAAEQLAAKDALSAFESIEKTHGQLQTLAAAMPRELPIDRKEIKDVAVRERIGHIEVFGTEQKQIREETEKLLADWMKSGGHGSAALKDKTEKLAADLLELSQKGSTPEAKTMAKESMQALDDAKKAMDASQEMKAKGDPVEAKKMDDEAAKKLEIAVKQLAKLAQDQAMKNPPKKDAVKTAEALAQSTAKMRQAEGNLPKMPKDAEVAMKAAAKKLAEAASQMSKQGAKSLPNPAARNPAAKAMITPGGSGLPGHVLKNIDRSVGKSWGELPGELKTRMLQDFRARFGDEHAEMIRQYFDRLAETPRAERKQP